MLQISAIARFDIGLFELSCEFSMFHQFFKLLMLRSRYVHENVIYCLAQTVSKIADLIFSD